MQSFHKLRERATRLGSRRADAAGLLLLFGLAATAPFPLGGVLPPGTFRIELLAFLAAAAAALGHHRGRALPRPALVAAGCAAALCLLGLFQLLPLPAGLVHTLSPASSEVYSGAAAVLEVSGGASRVVPAAPAPRISIAPNETRAVVLLTASTAAAFLAAASLLVTRNRRRGFAIVLLASMAAQAAWGVATQQESGRVSGPYYNPDHFAGYLGIGLAVAFGGMIVALAGRPRQRGPISSDWLERRIASGAVGVLLWAFFASVLALTHSRGGMLAGAATTLFLAGLAVSARVRREHGIQGVQQATLAAGIALGVLFVVAALGSRPLLRFLSTDPRDLGADTRVLLWSSSVETWKSYPVFGSGLGTFREAFRVEQPRDLVGLVKAAHGDFLQLLVTGGVVGAILGAAAWVSLALYLLRGGILRIRHEEGAVALAGLGALVSISLHGLVEFNLSMPATLVTLALVAGAAVAAVRDAETMAGRGPARTGSETTTTP